jgi:hypothetical protein
VIFMGRFWRRFFAGFVLGITHEVIVPLGDLAPESASRPLINLGDYDINNLDGVDTFLQDQQARGGQTACGGRLDRLYGAIRPGFPSVRPASVQPAASPLFCCPPSIEALDVASMLLLGVFGSTISARDVRLVF